MFVHLCDDTSPHAPHQHTRVWFKSQLPELRNPDIYPASWTALYNCYGVTGEENAAVAAAIRTYAEHVWHPTPMLCACGLYFEASSAGHKLHAIHQMEEVLKASKDKTCRECSAELMVDVKQITMMSVFCPNSDCEMFAQSYWVDR